MITTGSEELYQKLLLYRNHGLMNRNEARFFAYNCRLDSLKAAVAQLQIKNIGKVTEKRNRNAGLYDAGLADLKTRVKIPPRRTGVRQAFHTYVIQVEIRDELVVFLEEKGVETKIHYPIPIHLMEAARSFGYRVGDFPVAEAQAASVISLPVHQYLDQDQIHYVVNCLRVFYG